MLEKDKRRADRRKHTKVKKKKARRVMKEMWGGAWNGEDDSPSARDVGIMASTHNVPCSCDMCGNPRRKLGEKTFKEEVFDLSSEESLLEEGLYGNERVDDVSCLQEGEEGDRPSESGEGDSDCFSVS